MSLTVCITKTKPTEVFSSNITHNLNVMADEAGIYKLLWRPEEIGIKYAYQVIDPLKKGLEELTSHPEKYKRFNAVNGWGTYEQFIPWIEEYIQACEADPSGEIEVCR